MFNYNVNWEERIKELIPSFLRKPRFIEWAYLPIKMVKNLHFEFLGFRFDTLYNASFNSQIVYLEKLLNDRFDNINKGIYILNTADIERQYIFNKNELRPAIMFYNKFDYDTVYEPFDYCVYNNVVYKALVNVLHTYPDTSVTEWEVQGFITFLKNNAEFYGNTDFVIFVRANFVYNVFELIALVNFYKLAGKRFTIQTY
jgi:hypothetical protein